MEKQLIITVGREFGSAGHEIAEKLADKLGIDFIDRNLLKDIATLKNLDHEVLEKYDEKPIRWFFSRTVRDHSNSIEENIAQLQFNYLKELAHEGKSFVVVGRCAENVLQACPNMVSLFILGDMECKIKRTMEVYSLSRNKAMEKIRRHDKSRKKYHNDHCGGKKWGDSRNYEICINSSKLGVEKTVDYLYNYITQRYEQMH